MKVRKYLDWTIFTLCIIGFIVEFCFSQHIHMTEVALGIIGAMYCATYLIVSVCYPIKRDWILAKGSFLIKVLNFVLLIPFVIVLFFNLCNKKDFNPRNLVFDENLYSYNNENRDILGVANVNVLKDSVFLKAHNLEIINDTIVIQKNKLSGEGMLEQKDPSLFWTIYYHFIDPGNQHMTTSEVGRKRAALIAILGFLLLNGLLISTLISWFDRRRDLWIKGEINYKYFKRRWRLHKHYIVIGGSDVVVGIVEQLLKNKFRLSYPYVVIQTSTDVDALRRKLFSILTEQQQKSVVLYYGSCTSDEDLLRLGFNNAKEVYIIGEDTRTDDVDSYHDTLNMECLERLLKLYKQTPDGKKITAKVKDVNKLKEKLNEVNGDKNKERVLREDTVNAKLDIWWKSRPRLNCRVMFEYQTTFSVFQFFDIDERMTTYINFKPFNYYEMWAQKVFINRSVEKDVIERNFNTLNGYMPLEGSVGISQNSDNYVHLFVVGMSRMGVAMGIEAAHISHFPNYTEQTKIRTKITFIDTNAANEKDFFIGRFKDLFNLSHWRYGAINENRLIWEYTTSPDLKMYNHLGGDFLDIEWEFISGGVEQSAIQEYILSSTNSKARVTIAICLPESNKAHAAALYLDKRIFESDKLMQVLVYNRNGNAIINAISKNNLHYPYHGKLRNFGCATDCMAISHVEISEYIGEQIDRAYNGGKDGNAIEKKKDYGGKSKEAMKWSSIYNGNTMWTKLRSIGFNPSQPTINEKSIQILADVEHNRWNIEELLMNFRPLTLTEQADLIAQRVTKDQKKSEMAHLNLCSNKKLMEIDKKAQQYDKDLTTVLGDIYQKVKIMEETTRNIQ